MIAVGAKDAATVGIGQSTTQPTVYVGVSLVWSGVPTGVAFMVVPSNALLRQNEPVTFDVETSEAATFNWYSGATLLTTGTSYTPSAGATGTFTLRVAAIVEGVEKNSINVNYNVESGLPVVTDLGDMVTLTVQFVGEDIDIYRFLEYQPFNTMSFPRNTIINGLAPVMSSGYTVTPAYHTVQMDQDKTVTFTVTQEA